MCNETRRNQRRIDTLQLALAQAVPSNISYHFAAGFGSPFLMCMAAMAPAAATVTVVSYTTALRTYLITVLEEYNAYKQSIHFEL